MALAAGCLSRAQLRALAAAALKAAGTVADQRVYEFHGQPFNLTEFPALVVSTPAERKETNGTGAPQFFTTITLAVMGRVAPGSEASAEAQLDLLIEQAQRAILCTPSVIMAVQRFEFVETQAIVSTEGENVVGEFTAMFGCQIWQLYEPDTGEPWIGVTDTIPTKDGTGAAIVFQAP